MLKNANKNLLNKEIARTRVSSSTAQNERYNGETLIAGIGEFVVLVAFPVAFTERPHFTFGWEYDTDFKPVPGSFAWGVPVVSKWERIQQNAGFEGYYVGAELSGIMHGTKNQQVWLHWTMEGKALQNPIGIGRDET